MDLISTRFCENSDRNETVLSWLDSSFAPALDPTHYNNKLVWLKACRISDIDAPLMEGSDDAAISFSSDPSGPQGLFGISQRVILTPKPPSKRSSNRSPSPTRKLLTLLEQANPPVKCCQPGSVAQPQNVACLRKHLVGNLGIGVIPGQLKERLIAADSDGFEDIPSTAFDIDSFRSSHEVNELWEAVHKVYVAAERCHNRHKDENAWVQVVRSVFGAAGLDSPQCMLEVNSIQTQQIDPDLLPVLPNSVLPIAKKADLVFGFSPDHLEVAPVIKRFLDAHPGTSLSQMADAYTSTIPLVCGIEVKEAGGGYNEAVMQLAIWCSAGLEKVKRLNPDMKYETLLPFIGWTIIGHEWKLHLAWKESDGRVVVLGPWTILTCGTGSYHDIFTLLELIKRVKYWVESKYWPWLANEIMIS